MSDLLSAAVDEPNAPSEASERRLSMIVSDIDGTLVGAGAASVARLNRALLGLKTDRALQLSRDDDGGDGDGDGGQGFLFACATGRPFEAACDKLSRDEVLRPDYLISGTGALIHKWVDEGRDGGRWEEVVEWTALWEADFDEALTDTVRTVVAEEFPDFELGTEEDGGRGRVVCYVQEDDWDREGPALQARLAEALPDASLKFVHCYGAYLDILPGSVDKGSATAYLCALIGVPRDEVLVAGDSANDIGLFERGGAYAVAVANSSPPLRDWCLNVIEGGAPEGSDDDDRDRKGDGDGGDGAADVEGPPTIFMAERAAAWGLLDGLIHFGFTTETKISTADSVPGIVLSTP